MRNLSIGLVSFVAVNLLLATVIAAPSAFSPAPAAVDDRPPVVVKADVEVGTTIQTELVTMSLKALAPIDVRIDKPVGDPVPVPTIFEIFVEIKLPGIDWIYFHEEPSIFEMKADIKGNPDTERVFFSYTGGFTTQYNDPVAMLMWLADVKIEGSSEFEGLPLMGDFRISTESFFDVFVEITDVSGPPVLLSRHSTSGSLGMIAVVHPSGDMTGEVDSEFDASIERGLPAPNEIDAQCEATHNVAVSVAPVDPETGTYIEHGTKDQLRVEVEPLGGDLIMVEVEREVEQETAIETEQYVLKLSGSSEGKWKDTIDENDNEIHGTIKNAESLFLAKIDPYVKDKPPKEKPPPKKKPFEIKIKCDFISDDIPKAVDGAHIGGTRTTTVGGSYLGHWFILCE